MKRIVSWAVLLLVFSSIIVGARAAKADETMYTEGYFYYTIEDGSITITGYFGDETIVIVPNNIAGIPVNAIHGGCTFVTILLLLRPILEKLERVKVKYGILDSRENK